MYIHLYINIHTHRYDFLHNT